MAKATGATLTIRGNAGFHGSVIAPNTTATLPGGSNFYGAVTAGFLRVAGHAQVHVDSDAVFNLFVVVARRRSRLSNTRCLLGRNPDVPALFVAGDRLVGKEGGFVEGARVWRPGRRDLGTLVGLLRSARLKERSHWI